MSRFYSKQDQDLDALELQDKKNLILQIIAWSQVLPKRWQSLSADLICEQLQIDAMLSQYNKELFLQYLRSPRQVSLN